MYKLKYLSYGDMKIHPYKVLLKQNFMKTNK